MNNGIWQINRRDTMMLFLLIDVEELCKISGTTYNHERVVLHTDRVLSRDLK